MSVGFLHIIAEVVSVVCCDAFECVLNGFFFPVLIAGRRAGGDALSSPALWGKLEEIARMAYLRGMGTEVYMGRR